MFVNNNEREHCSWKWLGIDMGGWLKYYLNGKMSTLISDLIRVEHHYGM